MVVRLSAPGTPIKLIDLGPGVGRHHRYEIERKTVDDMPRFDGRKPQGPMANLCGDFTPDVK